MAYRLKNASTYFVGTWIDVASDNSSKTADMDPLHLIGYVVGTCTASEQLEHETMFTHNESGSTSPDLYLEDLAHSFSIVSNIVYPFHLR